MATNNDKIKSMEIEDWQYQILNDEHLIPSLCFMCVGCEKCDENCVMGITEWLSREVNNE